MAAHVAAAPVAFRSAGPWESAPALGRGGRSDRREPGARGARGVRDVGAVSSAVSAVSGADEAAGRRLGFGSFRRSAGPASGGVPVRRRTGALPASPARWMRSRSSRCGRNAPRHPVPPGARQAPRPGHPGSRLCCPRRNRARPRRSRATPSPCPRKQLGFEMRIVSQPGIACRFDDAFFSVVIGKRSVGSRKSTYVQATRFPASSTW